jgi:hypothetical protein
VERLFQEYQHSCAQEHETAHQACPEALLEIPDRETLKRVVIPNAKSHFFGGFLIVDKYMVILGGVTVMPSTRWVPRGSVWSISVLSIFVFPGVVTCWLGLVLPLIVLGLVSFFNRRCH